MRTKAEIQAERREMVASVITAEHMIKRELRQRHPDFSLIESAQRVCAERRIFIKLLDWVLGVVDIEGNPE